MPSIADPVHKKSKPGRGTRKYFPIANGKPYPSGHSLLKSRRFLFMNRKNLYRSGWEQEHITIRPATWKNIRARSSSHTACRISWIFPGAHSTDPTSPHRCDSFYGALNDNV